MPPNQSVSSSRGATWKSGRSRWHLPLLAGLSLAFATACGEDDDGGPVTPPVEGPPKYEATIRRTAHGIPHIIANDMGSLSYGQGYAFAKDHVCILSDQILKVRGERARYLGAGPGNTYAGSDFGYRVLQLQEKAQAAFPTLPADIQEMFNGYAAGFNKYLSETPAAELPAPCTNAPWVKPIQGVDLLAYDISVGLAGSAYQLILAIAAASPPIPGAGSEGRPVPGSFKVERPDFSQVGSNGWAIGADRSASGHGMVVANPHFPWEGELKLWESQLTVPGQLNVYGVGLLGVPAVLIGFNDNVAWTHTFSSGQRMTLYGLQLVPGNPTRYKYGTEERDMTARDITILVRLPEGSLTNITQRFYSSHYGPVIVIPGTAPWTTQSVLSFRDTNLDNTQLVTQFVGMNRAKSLEEFQNVYANVQGIPWVNTMAADRAGNVWYTDATPTPNLTATAIGTWRAASSGLDPATTAIWQSMGLVLLDGSNPENEWRDAAGARGPGLVPFSGVPKLARRDFVFNANDSYWLANPSQPLTGFSPLHGLEGVGQTPRTRMNAVLLTEENGASGSDYKFTVAELENAILGNRGMTAELLRDQLVARCTGKTTVQYNTTLVDIRQGCAALATWDLRYDVGSRGAALWREFSGHFSMGALSNGGTGTLFANPFNVAQPIATPNTLAAEPAAGTDPTMLALAAAVYRLQVAGIPVDAPLGDSQYTTRVDGKKIPIHGGGSYDGTANVVSWGTLKSTTPDSDFSAVRGTQLLNSRTNLTNTGYVINNGSSFIMAMEFTDTGVNGRAVLTYSESSDKNSPYFSDQTELFSNKQWRPIVFTEEAIAATKVEEKKISGN
ncbi:acylase [Myxococcus llanfairpwllgwyngyllgogerychwyrndrobwllllantysiliogogogochensis]|uniref:Acylase n=1 Tax=Myxococcus llanfairpwllgwyngyllgogerychwyrndrobwllllantysiliogogogochensis TaxID=2590453 RepID=A0A540WZU0_9BACT|nr:acylase [Myxococcus llanfairpwllgwyngyllgogerychwyrndrobwllllantysiliogogogochensis]